MQESIKTRLRQIQKVNASSLINWQTAHRRTSEPSDMRVRNFVNEPSNQIEKGYYRQIPAR